MSKNKENATSIIEPIDNNLILIMGLIFLVIDLVFLVSPFVLDKLSNVNEFFAIVLSAMLNSLLETPLPIPGLLAVLGLFLIVYAIVDKLNWW
jgi:hypothetical protein